MTAILLRFANPAAPETSAAMRSSRARSTRELLQRRFGEAGWYALTGDDEAELRCMAVAPAGMDAGIPGAAETAERILAALVSELHSSLGLRVLAGACPSQDGTPRFHDAREAGSLARVDRPVVVLPPVSREAGLRPSEGEGLGAAVVDRAEAYLRDHLADDLSLLDVARVAGTAPSHLSRLFRRYRGDTFVQVFCRLRIDAAKRLLRTGRYRVKEVGALVGFKDTAYFCRVFRKYEGQSPAEYQAGSR